MAIIVPVRNEERFIGRTLDALLCQEYPQELVEIHVVDGLSSDRTRDIVNDYCRRNDRVFLHENPKYWSSSARNIGIRKSKGDLILVVDGHCELTDRKYLNNLEAAFQRSKAACLGRPQPLDVSHASDVQRAIAAARQSSLGHHPDSYIYSTTERIVPAHSVAVAYRRDVFQKVGFFDERFDACEDVELNHRIDRAGLTCFFTPDIMIRYEPRGTLRGLFRQLVRYGRGRIRLLRKHSDTFSLKTLVPGVFVAGLFFGTAGAFLNVWLAVVFGIVMGIYFLIVMTGTMFAAKKAGTWRAIAWLPCVFFAIHFASGVGQWTEVLFGRRDMKIDPAITT